MFQFLASTDAAKTYTFKVRQTYSDGTVVDWSGPESSDTPAPSIEAKSIARRWRREQHARDRRARPRGARLAVARRGLARGSGRRDAGVTRRGRLVVGRRGGRGRACATRGRWAHASLVRTTPVGERHRQRTPPRQVVLTYSEAVEPRFAIVSVTDAAGQQQIAGPPARRSERPDDARRAAAAPFRGLVPRLLARDLGRRTSGSRRVHVRGRPEPRAGAAVPDPLDLGNRRDPGLVAARAIVFLSIMAAIGLFFLRVAIARPVVRRVLGDTPSRRIDRLRDRCADRL